MSKSVLAHTSCYCSNVNVRREDLTFTGLAWICEICKTEIYDTIDDFDIDSACTLMCEGDDMNETITTADGAQVGNGDRVWCFYATPLQWGTIVSEPASDGWVRVSQEDGTQTAYNGDRLAAVEPGRTQDDMLASACERLIRTIDGGM